MSVPPDIEVLDADNARVAINAPLDPGRAVAAESRPVAVDSETKAVIDALATQVTVAAILAKLSADPATQTTMAAILAKIIAAPATEAKQDTANTSLASIITALATNHADELQLHSDIATTLIAKEEAIRALLAGSLTVATHAVTQSGTWTVQPGNTANTTAWKVDGSAVTQPVSLASVPSHAVTGSGNFASTVADGVNVVEGAVADAVVAAGAAGSISAKLRAISRDIVANIVLAAGANAIGKLAANSGVVIGAVENNAVATVGGLASTSRLLSAAATTNATSVKGSAGRLYKMQGYNAATSVRYLKLYNKASAPTVGSDTPVRTIALPPGAGFDLDWSNLGYYFSTGIAYALTTGSADADTGALTAGDILGLNMDYA